MRFSKINLGEGLFRVKPIATEPWENVSNVPTHVMDVFVKHALKNDNFSETVDEIVTEEPKWNDCFARHSNDSWKTQPRDCNGKLVSKKTEPCCLAKKPTFEVSSREPDGFDCHIDKPIRSNYDCSWDWQNDLKKYHTAEEAVKACDWECREEPAWADKLPKGLEKGQGFAKPCFEKPTCKPKATLDEPKHCCKKSEKDFRVLANSIVDLLQDFFEE